MTTELQWRKSALGTVAALSLALTTGAALAADYTPEEKKLIDAAKAEGGVTVLHPILGDYSANLISKAFIDFYQLGPDFKFNNLRKGTGQTVSQVRQEIQAGKFTVDILMVSAAGFFEEAAKRGAFEKLESAQWKEHEALVKKAGQYSNYPYVIVPFAYTFRPIWNTSCEGMPKDFKVTSYNDTWDPRLKGKTTVSDITKSFTYSYTFASLLENGIVKSSKEFWQKTKALDPVVAFRSEEKAQLVISCERPFETWITAGRVLQNVMREPKLKEMIKIGYFKEGQVMLGNQAAVIKGGPHPNAGKLFLEFLMRKEGADALAKGEALYTFRKGYKAPPEVSDYMLDLSEHTLLGLKDWVATQKTFKELRDEWQSFFK